MEKLTHNFDDLGYYLGSDKATKDPLENDLYLLPRNATFLKPLNEKDGKLIKWNGKKWIYEDIEKPKEPTISEKKELKINELDNYYFISPEIREMKINNRFVLSLSTEGRKLIIEQIQHLEQQIKLKVIAEEDAKFEYFYEDGSISITLVQLRQLYIFMLNVTNANYGIYKTHIHTLNNLTTIEEIDKYDFTTNYLKNQKLNIE